MPWASLRVSFPAATGPRDGRLQSLPFPLRLLAITCPAKCVGPSSLMAFLSFMRTSSVVNQLHLLPYSQIISSRLDDMVEKVLTVSQATDATMEVEKDRQANAVRVCVELLDASAEHYENLVLLRDELRKREKLKNQHPPTIVLSSQSSCQ